MKKKLLPLNIRILDMKKVPIGLMSPVTSQDIYDGLTTNTHDNGLYSIPIFGRIGSEERDERFSYIDAKLSVFHPEIFRCISKLKQLYTGIMAGTTYAKWDEVSKDFIKSSDIEGATGFQFFLDHWKDIQFNRTDSLKRDDKIMLIEKYKNVALTSKILVLPAGLREIETDDEGRTVEPEINHIYRKLLAAVNTVSINVSRDDNLALYDNARWSVQNRFNEIYELIANMLSGKKGFIRGNWAKRSIFNGTRNVATAPIVSTYYTKSPKAPDINTTYVGLFQYLRAGLPLFQYKMQNGWLSQVFTKGSNVATLIDKKTLHKSQIELDPFTINRWTTNEGLLSLLLGYYNTTNRNKPVIINHHYLALVYSDDHTFKIFGDIDELPDNLNKKHVRPITYTELYYLSGYDIWNNYHATVCRYPIAGMGSVFPTKAYVKTTIKTTIKTELDDNWQPMNDKVALEYPDTSPTAKFFDSQAVHPSRNEGLTLDFDGDTLSFILVLGMDSNKECEDRLKSLSNYIDGKGNFLIAVTNDTVDFVLKAMTAL